MPRWGRRTLATLEGMDGVSKVIKLVIKLYNRGGGEGRGSCVEELNFPAGLLVVLVQVILGWFKKKKIPVPQGWKENLDKWYLWHPRTSIFNHALGIRLRQHEISTVSGPPQGYAGSSQSCVTSEDLSPSLPDPSRTRGLSGHSHKP